MHRKEAKAGAVGTAVLMFRVSRAYGLVWYIWLVETIVIVMPFFRWGKVALLCTVMHNMAHCAHDVVETNSEGEEVSCDHKI